jgi:histone-lysine N-methyltransferase SUV39H
VKTLQAIKKGSFVCEYVGEVIKNEEAEKRGKIYDAEGRTYLFDLDYNDSEQNPFTVDAAVYGNISHFINHSCEPNLAVYAVWINCLEPNLPKLALFATRNIREGEEIAFDYMCQFLKGNKKSSPNSDLLSESAVSPYTSPLRARLTLPSSEHLENCLPESSELVGEVASKTRCKCGAKKCRKYLF